MTLQETLLLSSSSPSHIVWATGSRAGLPALATKDAAGYLVGKVFGKTLKAHRVVFFLTHGYWPDQVDHINGVRDDNTPDNLRDVSRVENRHNRVHKGYHWSAKWGKYVAYISSGGVRHHLGGFDTPEGARAAYLLAKRQLHTTAPGRCYE
ncbi:HNH endonuclease [Pectobacterium phage vB_PatP_CB5]|uniref:HNH endonuclease n=2 Tax=Phimunavirus TaxID=2560202 RepID=A0A2U7N2L3_9CAUD|nr:HNH endonuclease [Pectobacterium phage vB_PatP_CB5]YP_009811847.1 HNH endonuclease [Pectobacterium phage Gaspode]ARW59013.1 HNH endonuclease [Pectobacterium phage vB_PatP_CB5]AXY81696.1 hypothetical protein [Pectobacterium phage Gaspode]